MQAVAIVASGATGTGRAGMVLGLPSRYDDRMETAIIDSKAEYDDSPWTRDELQALAWEAGKHAGWEDMDEYDDPPEKP
jgi:hypothetical protein